MAHVFISYAREDRAHAVRFAAALEASGWSVWWDRDIATGMEFDDAISEAIDRAQAMVVLWSSVSVDKDWVREEAGVGKDRGMLFPVFVEPGVDLPLGFRRINAADLSLWEGDEGDPAFQDFLSHIADAVGTDPRSRDWRTKVLRRFLRRRRMQVALAVTLALPAMLAGALALTSARSTSVSLDLSATRVDLVLDGDGALFPEVRELTGLTAVPMTAVRVSGSTGGPRTYDSSEGDLGLSLRNAVIDVEQAGVGAGTSMVLSFGEGAIVDLGTRLPSLKVATTGPVRLNLEPQGGSPFTRAPLAVAVDSATMDLTLSFPSDGRPRLEFFAGSGPPLLLLENVRIGGLRFADVTRVRRGIDQTSAGGTVRAGALVFYPSAHADTVALEAGDLLQFGSVSGTVTRLAATDTVFDLDFTGRVSDLTVTNGPARALGMPSVLAASWATRRSPLVVGLLAYLALAALVMRWMKRRRT